MKIFGRLCAATLLLLQTLIILPETKCAAADDISEKSSREQLVMLDQPCVISSGKSAEITFSLPVGEYEFSPIFRPTDANTQTIEYSIYIDESLPFEGAQLLTAQVLFEDSGEIRELSSGDQTAPKQQQTEGYMKCPAFDTTGVRLTPYTVSLDGKEHNLRITGVGADFLLAGFSFSTPEETAAYSQISAGYSSYKKYTGEPIVIEAEKPLYRNDFSLTAKADNSSAVITPNNAEKSVINYIGGANWSKPFQELAWEIDVPADGLYCIGFSFKQNTVIGGSAFRHLKIDGITPFEETAAVGFPYKTAWQYKRLADFDGEDYLFYLTAGKHKLSLTVTLGEVSEIYSKLQKISEKIGDMYLDIVMITGETPDANRDYELYKQIPDYETHLQEFYDELEKLSDDLQTRREVNGELDAAVKNMMRVCRQMHDNRYASHLFLDTYYSYYQTLCSWLFDIKDMSMSLDKIVLCAPDGERDIEETGLFGKIIFGMKRFFASFAGDYSVNSLENSDAESIKIWVNWGRDQVKVLNMLIQENFSAETGINVCVEQVNASLIQGIISDNSPDLYLQLARTEPVNLAMRGVLYELSSFDDYEEVLENFAEGAEIPYIYNGECYALPDTQDFNVMFCRDDILAELGIDVPQTWDDFLSATAVLQRKNMNTYLPYTRIASATTVNTGVGGLSIFPTLLMQRGETMYNDSLTETRLSSPVSVEAFTFWTDFYTRYKLQPDVSFYQRFRVGTIPLGIASYTNTLTFSVAAPEIEGRWSVHTIPGTETEDGAVNRVTSGAGTGCAIMKSSKHKQAAWEFLKWWVSEDTQYSYSANVEAVLGQSGRIPTSNVKAMARLSWDRSALDAILKQWENVREIEEVPGSYYVSRSVDQAFWAVYNDTATQKEAITEWAKVSNLEIKRKIAEYPTDKD